MHIPRRRFLGIASTAAGALAVGGGLAIAADRDNALVVAPPEPTAGPTVGPTVGPGPALTDDLPPVDRRVLVVVQMGGGNDGLNTLVPVGSGRYHDLRPTIALGEDDVVELAGTTEAGLHPALAPLAGLWDAGHLAAVQGIGIAEQSRSHFVALDTWWNGSAGSSAAGGWLGRWLDATATEVGDPDPMRAIAIGGGSPALIGTEARPVIVQSAAGFDLRGPTPTGQAQAAFEAMGSGSSTGLLASTSAAIPVAVDAVATLQDAFGDHGDDQAVGESSTLASFNAAADVIEADLGTKVVFVNLGGYDTHANQLATHERLHGEFAAGLTTMLDRLTASGHADRTLTMTFSEFGRRAAENGSGGTDHGRGGLAFMAGPAVARSQIVGSLDLGNLENGDTSISVETGSLYANALDWLGGPADDVLGASFDRYALLR